MLYVKNDFTNDNKFYHSSHKGIVGEISPNANNEKKKQDFGKGFYLGNKIKQTIALVNSDTNPKLYEIRIPYDILNETNTLLLSKEDWVYFVLYNRGYLEPIKDTDFYKYYENLSNGKHFIVGTIADDVFSTCMKDFVNGTITDYMFMQLIDCYSYGIQIVAKTEEACKILDKNIVSEREITKEERENSLASRRLTRREQEIDYIERRADLLKERKGKFISELFNDVRLGILLPPQNNENMTNVKFETPIHTEREDDDEYEFYK